MLTFIFNILKNLVVNSVFFVRIVDDLMSSLRVLMSDQIPSLSVQVPHCRPDLCTVGWDDFKLLN